MVQAPKKEQVLAARQACVETLIGSGMVPKLPTNSARRKDSVVTGNSRAAASRQKERG